MASTTRFLLPALAVLAVLSPFTYAQTVLNYAQLPVCAQQCTYLTQAQAACVNAAGGEQACFCQSAYLTTLKQSPTGLCDAFCTPPDLTLIYNWYNTLCAQPAQPGTSSIPGTTLIVVTSTANPVATISPTSTVRSSSNTISNSRDDDPEGGWFANHWRWVLMLIIIFVGLVLISIIGVYLKRRHDKKKDAVSGNMAAHDAPYTGPPPPDTFHSKHPDVPSSGRPQMAAVAGSLGFARNSLTSLGRDRRSRGDTIQGDTGPVVWGPHQHQAAADVGTYGGIPVPESSPSGTPVSANGKGKMRESVVDLGEDAVGSPLNPSRGGTPIQDEAAPRRKLSKRAR
ncbi:hypothetical protein H2201_007479 [Coniosporium apollinis]|uniref:Extracellular membrane protein CFEM domain-containing protein n=1 Tax=Coniosporium apollinis TaxID=61459 RepID=A0ABQ9NIW8_9PEZI|nr:hypothetical protein H2201_007479 [Coniosporium apollinis]